MSTSKLPIFISYDVNIMSVVGFVEITDPAMSNEVLASGAILPSIVFAAETHKSMVTSFGFVLRTMVDTRPEARLEEGNPIAASGRPKLSIISDNKAWHLRCSSTVPASLAKDGAEHELVEMVPLNNLGADLEQVAELNGILGALMERNARMDRYCRGVATPQDTWAIKNSGQASPLAASRDNDVDHGADGEDRVV